MVELELGYKGVRDGGFLAIGQAFGASKQLSKLDLSRNNGAGDDGVVAFCKAAQRAASPLNVLPFQALTFLDLSDCQIGPRGIRVLAESFSGYEEDCNSGECSVTSEGSGSARLPLVLLLNSNPCIGRSPEDLSAFRYFLQPPSLEYSHLTTLKLTHCDINDEGIKALCSAVDNGGCSGLLSLDLSHNRIGVEGAKFIAEALACNVLGSTSAYRCKLTTLQELYLAGNPIESDGAVAIAASLKQREVEDEVHANTSNIALQVLDLSKTCCGHDGAAAILKCGCLTLVRIFDNNLCSAGFQHMCPLLKGGHPSLNLLDLSGNRAEDAAVCALLNTLMEDRAWESSLRVLELGGNKFGSDSEDAVKRLKEKRPELDIARDRPN